MEMFKDVVGWEGLYRVSNLGKVFRCAGYVKRLHYLIPVRAKEMIPKDNGRGYLRIKLTRENMPRRVMLHRIIAEAFIPNPNNLKVVNHKNGIKTDNRIENLEWCTQSENCLHAFKTGLRKFSEENRARRSELTRAQPRDWHGRLMKKQNNDLARAISA